MRQKLARATSTVALMTFISRILGFLRDMVLAQVFGATAGFDAFLVAFKIPNFFRRLFGEGAFSQAFVPVLAEYRSKRTEEETREFVNRIAGTLGVALVAVTLIAELVAPLIVAVFAPGFQHDPTRFMLASHMIRTTFPYLIFICLTAFAGAILNTYGNFSVPAFTPVILNICMIACAWWLAPHFKEPIYALGWGVTVSGLVQCWFQWPYLKKINVLPRFLWGWKDPGVRRVLKLMLPALFGVSVAQLSLLIDGFFASYLPVGSISWLYYSDRITYLPLGVIGVALATVVLPVLSRHHADESKEAYAQTLNWALRCAWLIGLPAAIALLTLAGPILATLIQHGAFSARDVVMTTRSLTAYAFGLPAFMLVKVVASAFYAQKNIKLPVKIAVVALVVNIILNFILIGPLAHAGLALSSAIASIVNVSLLWIMLKRAGITQMEQKPRPIFLRVILASILMAGLLWWGSGSIDTWFLWSVSRRVLHLVVLIVSGLVIYFGALWMTGLRLKDFASPTY